MMKNMMLDFDDFSFSSMLHSVSIFSHCSEEEEEPIKRLYGKYFPKSGIRSVLSSMAMIVQK